MFTERRLELFSVLTHSNHGGTFNLQMGQTEFVCTGISDGVERHDGGLRMPHQYDRRQNDQPEIEERDRRV